MEGVRTQLVAILTTLAVGVLVHHHIPAQEVLDPGVCAARKFQVDRSGLKAHATEKPVVALGTEGSCNNQVDAAAECHDAAAVKVGRSSAKCLHAEDYGDDQHRRAESAEPRRTYSNRQ